MIGIPRTESDDELAQLYTKAAININPSKEESFSFVTIEAMACGRQSLPWIQVRLKN